MGQIQLTHEEREEALQRFGYTETQARFLSIAALHSGYFLGRQYLYFLNERADEPVDTLVEKLFHYGHATAAAYEATPTCITSEPELFMRF